jgi:AcrR family transcriptional regulator
MEQPLPARRPPKAERDQARRDQIIAAARQCVVRRGFHAAPMAEIAAMAQMSVGQIYRYFSNKEAIVHAIVERIVAVRLAEMIEVPETADLAEALARMLLDPREDDRENRILMLEITAEATRNPAVAEIVKRADQRIKERAVAATLKRLPHLTRSEALARVDVIAALMEGTVFRRLGGVVETPGPLELYRDIIERVFAAP